MMLIQHSCEIMRKPGTNKEREEREKDGKKEMKKRMRKRKSKEARK